MSCFSPFGQNYFNLCHVLKSRDRIKYFYNLKQDIIMMQFSLHQTVQYSYYHKTTFFNHCILINSVYKSLAHRVSADVLNPCRKCCWWNANRGNLRLVFLDSHNLFSTLYRNGFPRGLICIPNIGSLLHQVGHSMQSTSVPDMEEFYIYPVQNYFSLSPSYLDVIWTITNVIIHIKESSEGWFPP